MRQQVENQVEVTVNGMANFVEPAIDQESQGRPRWPLSDLGNAERLVDRFRSIFRYCKERGKWFVYKYGRWVEDNDGHIFRLAYEIVRDIDKEAARDDLPSDAKADIAKHKEKSMSKGRIKAMIELAQWLPGIAISSEAFDQDPWLLSCLNGTLDLRDMTLREHQPEDLITKMVQTEYQPEATCPTFEAFIAKVMNNGPELIDFLTRAFGYVLTGLTSEQCMFIFHGPGANGKTTLLEIIRELLGDHAMHTTTSTLLRSGGTQIRNDLARLNSVRFVSAVEVGMGKRLDEALVKQLTGGDQVTARFLFKEYFEFKPKFKLFIAANHKPEIRGVDHGIWRRIHLIPFEVKISPDEMDKDLVVKLRDELPGILAWAARGCQQWHEQGLKVPESIKRATQNYRTDMDYLEGFFDDRCIKENDERVPVGDLYTAYKDWTDSVCQDYVGKKVFGNLMSQKGFSQMKSGSVRYWKDITLIPRPKQLEVT